MTEPKCLQPTDVIGRVLYEITQKFQMDDDGVDFAWSYYHLDSGVVLSLRGNGYGGSYLTIPSPDASPIEHPLLDRVCNQRIVAVLREPPNSDVYQEAPYLILENGYVVSDVFAVPNGVLGAGVLILEPNEIDLSKLVPLWD
jgi:hypothetical protein